MRKNYIRLKCKVLTFDALLDISNFLVTLTRRIPARVCSEKKEQYSVSTCNLNPSHPERQLWKKRPKIWQCGAQPKHPPCEYHRHPRLRHRYPCRLQHLRRNHHRHQHPDRHALLPQV
jgi:hypothetical protein